MNPGSKSINFENVGSEKISTDQTLGYLQGPHPNSFDSIFKNNFHSKYKHLHKAVHIKRVITFTSTLGTKYPARFSRLLMKGKGSGDNSGALRQTTEQGIPFTS